MSPRSPARARPDRPRATPRRRGRRTGAHTLARHRSMLDAAFDEFYALRPRAGGAGAGFEIAELNARAALRLGVAPEAAAGLAAEPLLARVGGAAILDAAARCLETGVAHERELELAWPGRGAEVWVRAVPVDGEAVVSVTDVTRRKTVERALAEKEALFRTAFEHAGVGMAVISPGGELVRANPALCTMLGYLEEELLRGGLDAVLHPDDRSAVREWTAALLAGRVGAFELEHRLVRRDGVLVWVLAAISLVRAGDGDGAPLCLVLQAQDVTRRREAEARLRRSEALHRAVTRHYPNGAILLFDHDLRYVLADGQALRDAGTAPEALVGRTIHEALSPEEVQILEPYYRAALGGAWSVFELPTGGRDLLVHVTPVFGEGGGVLYGMVASQDISELKRSEEALRRSLRAQDVLLQEVHHRVKNNLQVISSLLNLQAARTPAGESLDALRSSQARVEAIAILYERLHRAHELAHVDAAAYFGDIVRTVLATFGADRVAPEVRGQVSLVLDAAVPCGLFLNELCTNAVKHAWPADAPGRLTVDVRKDGGDVVVEVADDGRGLPEGIAAGGRGAGLGLQLVRALTRQLRGTLEIEGGPGARFRLRFPG